MRKVIYILFAALLMSLANVPGNVSAASKVMKVYVDGELISFDKAPFSENGYMLVQFRPIFEKLGLNVEWDADTWTVTGSKPGLTLKLTIGDENATVNGKTQKLAVKPRVVGGYTFVPLRFVGESTGAKVDWNEENWAALISQMPTDLEGTGVLQSNESAIKEHESKPVQQPDQPQQLTVEEIGKLSDRVVYIEVLDRNGQVQGSGSGVIVGSEGEVLTNYHVIDGANSVRIDLNDKRSFTTSTLLIKDEVRDLALLKINATSLPVVALGDSSALKLGEEVVAIGSPLGFKNTLTSGVVSTPLRMVDGQNFIQISTPIDHGSSGGALFNRKGELVGITTALIESSADINLAIPSNDVAVFLTKNKVPQVLTESKPALTMESLQDYLNNYYGTITFKDIELHFSWIVFMSNDNEHYLIGGTLYDMSEYADLLGYQIDDRTAIPGMVYYIIEELRKNLGIENTFVTLYVNGYFDFYPSAFPAVSITPEYPGFRLNHNFIYGSIDYSTGYFHYNLTPERGSRTIEQLKVQ